MSDFYFSTSVGNDTVLCISPLSDEQLSTLKSDEIHDPVGYFLYERRASESPSAVSVIARITSEDGVWRLSRLLGMR